MSYKKRKYFVALIPALLQYLSISYSTKHASELLQDSPSVKCETAMYWDTKFVKPLSDYRIYVEIEDGRKGIFDMKPYLDRGVFRELRNVHYFNQVGILFGAVTWPNEQDIAPETLIAEMLPVKSSD